MAYAGLMPENNHARSITNPLLDLLTAIDSYCDIEIHHRSH